MPRKEKDVQTCKKGDSMHLISLSEEYRTAADALSKRLAELRALLKTARGDEAFSLQRRIETMRAELTDLRAVRAYLLHYYEPGERGGRLV
ncbi:hypothetical protein D3Z39_03440 [Anaerotruncus colihominis]|uniref:Uncharacterized protein n=2 Tax=Anaerotruncus colihominis TaxID=169435 RepID=A0A845RG35_9FIRM|nr:hypothetical protein [Anaerotruncus colihominis]